MHLVCGQGGRPTASGDPEQEEAYGRTESLDDLLATSLGDRRHRPAAARLAFKPRPTQPYLKGVVVELQVSCHRLVGATL